MNAIWLKIGKILGSFACLPFDFSLCCGVDTKTLLLAMERLVSTPVQEPRKHCRAGSGSLKHQSLSFLHAQTNTDYRGNEFRTDFAKLNTFRYQIPWVPFGACTATAPPNKLLRIRQGLGIAVNALSLIEPINRANLFFGATVIKGGADGQGDLDWLIPHSNKGRDYNQSEIPPTIIYVDSKPLAHKIAIYLQSLLPPITFNRPILENRWNFDPRSRSERVVAVYHALLSHTMKEYTRADWGAGFTRVLVATSAWGMGIDNPFVQRVIQWKAKELENLNTLIQRFGRCARGPCIQGVCMLYYEKDCVGVRTVPPKPTPGARKRNADGVPKAQTNAEQRRGLLEIGLYRYINTQSNATSNAGTSNAHKNRIHCRRRVILGYYAD